MRFILLDKVISLEAGKSITAEKALSLAEEYLSDHFPSFPVLPGVLMIEAMVQTAALLVQVSQDFSHSMVVLSEARNVKYKSFVKPGNVLRIEVRVRELSASESSFSGSAWVGQQEMVSARFRLRHFNLADDDADMAAVDEQIIQVLRQRAKLLGATCPVEEGKSGE